MSQKGLNPEPSRCPGRQAVAEELVPSSLQLCLHPVSRCLSTFAVYFWATILPEAFMTSLVISLLLVVSFIQAVLFHQSVLCVGSHILKQGPHPLGSRA